MYALPPPPLCDKVVDPTPHGYTGASSEFFEQLCRFLLFSLRLNEWHKWIMKEPWQIAFKSPPIIRTVWPWSHLTLGDWLFCYCGSYKRVWNVFCCHLCWTLVHVHLKFLSAGQDRSKQGASWAMWKWLLPFRDVTVSTLPIPLMWRNRNRITQTQLETQTNAFNAGS